MWQGATENTTLVEGLLEDPVDRGLNLQRRYLVVIEECPRGWSHDQRIRCFSAALLPSTMKSPGGLLNLDSFVPAQLREQSSWRNFQPQPALLS